MQLKGGRGGGDKGFHHKVTAGGVKVKQGQTGPAVYRPMSMYVY